MAKIYNPPKHRAGMRATGTLIGVGVSALLFLAIPLTQIFTEYKKAPEEIEAIEMATPPPPPPPEEPPPPPEPEQEEPPPELDTPPPPISLEQLDMALNPGTGGALAGDFALPTFDVSGQDLGGVEIFDIMDADKKPVPTKQVEPRTRGQKGSVVLRFTVDQYGKVQNIRVHQSSNPKLNQACIEAVRRWEFTPGEKDGRTIITNNVQLPINFN
jgi:protein TonB